MNTPQTNGWRYLRRSLIGLAAVITLLGLFYMEENWRGKHAWDNCRRALEAQGVDFNWTAYIPAPVPGDQNVFGVPEMQQWFSGRGVTELSRELVYPRLGPSGAIETPKEKTNALLAVAEMKIQLPGTHSGSGGNALPWSDPHTPAEVARRIKEALGPVAQHPSSRNLLFTRRSPEDIRPAQILLECQTTPTTNDLLQFLPKTSEITGTTDSEPLQLVPEGGGFKVLLLEPETPAPFLAWADQFEPEFDLIRKALERPAVRMHASYNSPGEVPIPNFLTTRIFAQTLAAMTECHLLRENPDAALSDLTLMHDLCRIFTNRPITLVGSMLNVAVTGLYVDTIAHGLCAHAWSEPQLAALEKQLGSIDIIAPVHQSLRMEPLSVCEDLRSVAPSRLDQLVFADPAQTNSWRAFKTRLIPRGWIYQNMVVTAQRARQVDSWMDPGSRTVFPKRVDADQAVLSSLSHNSPNTFIAVTFIPNILKACQRTALFQTKVHQAIIACALERYRLAHGEFPENLSVLLPQYLGEIPNDVVGSRPPRYRRDADGAYTLYSIGWNETNAGGAPAKSLAEGDWVWPEPNLQ